MRLFFVVTTVLYLAGIGCLLWEYRAAPCEDRSALQTGPLLMGATVLYLVLILKTQQLAAFFPSV